MNELRCFPKRVKIEAVFRVWAGQSVSEIARTYGTSRQIIYMWKKKAELAVSRAMEGKRRGPKSRKKKEPETSVKIKVTDRESLPKTNKNKKRRIPFTGGENFQPLDNKRPSHCPVCGCQKIYKNGTYLKKNGTNNHKKKEVVQRYICVWCKSPVYLENDKSPL